MKRGRGKRQNETGTQPKERVVDAPGEKPGRKSVKGGAGRGTGPKHAAARAQGARTTETRKAGPKKTRAKTTSRSAEK